MSRIARLSLVLSLSIAALGIAGPAAHAGGSATYRLQLDAKPPKGEPWAFLRFFPSGKVSVHSGDVVKAAWAGTDTPHTATMVPAADPEAWRSDNQGPGGPFAVEVNDSTLGGDDNETVFNPAVAFPSSFACGTAATPCNFDGSGIVNAGLQFSDPSNEPSFFVQVNAPVGTYSLLCLLHPGMEVLLHVAPNGQSIPSPGQVSDRASAQLTVARKIDGEAADAQAQQVASKGLAGGGTRWTLSAGGFSNQVTANEYPDDGLKIHVGDQLRVTGTGEIHTATFPASAFDSHPLIVPQCEVPGPDTPAASPADCSDPSKFELAENPSVIGPTASNDLSDPSTFVNSGIVVGPTSFTFDATAPGIYQMICLVHGPEMETTLRVKA